MSSLPLSLTEVRLWFWKSKPCGDDVDQASQTPDLVGASTSSSTSEFEDMDPVSFGLRVLGGRLEEPDIRALITPNLFHYSDDDTTGFFSSWPHMRHLKVECHPCAPDGSWCFSGPRGGDPHATGFAITREEHYLPGQEDADETHALWSRDEDEYTGDDEISDARRPNMFRTLPIAERINPLLLAFASSLQTKRCPPSKTPSCSRGLRSGPPRSGLKNMKGLMVRLLRLPSAQDETFMFRWGVRYDAAKGDGKGKVTWQVGEDWRPVDEIVRAFKDLVGGGGENMEWEAFEFVGEKEQDLDIFI